MEDRKEVEQEGAVPPLIAGLRAAGVRVSGGDLTWSGAEVVTGTLADFVPVRPSLTSRIRTALSRALDHLIDHLWGASR